jgi:hypothetical protein
LNYQQKASNLAKSKSIENAAAMSEKDSEFE